MGMKEFSSDFTELTGRVDTVNGVIHGVSIITGGVTARGHDLQVDETTLKQIKECAEKMGTVPVKWNHRSGADAVAGYLDNFRIEGVKLLGDWHLLKSHSQYEQAIEMASRMPKNVGLSAAFMGNDEMVNGKKSARCEDLISVDVVAQPAANPNGLFSAKFNDSVDSTTKEITLMSNNTNTTAQATAQEPSMADLLAAITTINERLDAQDAFNSQLQDAFSEQDSDQEIGIEDLLTLTPDQISQLVASGEISEEDAAGISALQAEAFAGDDEDSETQESPAEEAAETAGAEAGAASGGSELSALRSQVRELSARLDREDSAKQDVTIDHHFATIENNLTELSTANGELKELNARLEQQNEAMRHALRTGTRPLAFSVEGEAVHNNGSVHEFSSLVKKHRDSGKTEAEAIRLAHKESPEAHADYLKNL
jgi:hypothetical protein